MIRFHGHQRLGLPAEGPVTPEHLALVQLQSSEDKIGATPVAWLGLGKKTYYVLRGLLPFYLQRQFTSALERLIHEKGLSELDHNQVLELALLAAPPEMDEQIRLMAQMVEAKA